MYDLRAILKRLKFPISTTLAGRSMMMMMIMTMIVMMVVVLIWGAFLY